MIQRLAARDSVAITGSIIGLASLPLGWLTLKSSRLAAGTSLNLLESLGTGGAIILILLWTFCFFLSLRGKQRFPAIALGCIGNLILAAIFLFVGTASSRLLGDQAAFARVAPSAGMWIALLGAYVVIYAARSRLSGERALKNMVSWAGLLTLGVLLTLGWFNDLSVVQEFTGREERFIQEVIRHIFLFGGSVTLGTLLGVPLGIWATRSRRSEKPIFFITNITQTIPSLALFGILIAPLSALSLAFPVLREIGIRGVGATPAFIALTIYCLLPIVRNTYVGLRQVDPAAVDAGLGMGMSRLEVFRRIEVPLALPLVLEGIRTAAVQSVGNTAVAALIGAGGLGHFIFQGLGQAAPDLIILGAIPIIVLALIVDGLMRTVVKVATPKGVQGGAS